ncbi:hypothetical protein P261_01989 [Lachnospiraceae bacterium TWA4]|nr:hypothetical protein P261_01989 [Lachnospiraceae bacterium TWA4]
MSIGTILRPDRPILRRSLSITKATLAIYPLSSNNDRKKNKITIIGKKLSTLPTPSKIPSSTNDCRASLTFPYCIASSTYPATHSIRDANKSCNQSPTTLKVKKKIETIMRIKLGIAVYLPVKILSIF